MPEVVSCPDCDKKLKVPDTLLGKRVKCPSCGVTFTAETDSAPPPEEEEQAPPSSGGKRRRAAEELDKISDRPSRRARDDEEEEEEEERPRRRRSRDDDEEEEDRPRRRKRRGRSAEAAARAKGPGIALLVVGILGILAGIANIVVALLDQGGPGGNQDAAYVAGRFVGSAVSLIWGAVVTLGGVKMTQTQSYGSAMTAAIVALLPCNPCCLLGLPFGIWALVVLGNADVKRAFE